MYIDNQTLLWDAVALSANASSTNTYDSLAAGNEIGTGEPLVAVIQVDVAADFTTGNETYQFDFIQSAAANLSSPDVLVSRVIAAASLTAGSIHYIPLPPGAKTARYLGLSYTGGGTTPTITVTAWITAQNMIQSYKSYPDGFTIS